MPLAMEHTQLGGQEHHRDKTRVEPFLRGSLIEVDNILGSKVLLEYALDERNPQLPFSCFSTQY